MSQGRLFTVDSGPIAVASASQTPILMVATPSTAMVHVAAFRFWIVSGSGVSYPSNGSVTWYFARATNTPAGGTSVTPTTAGQGNPAAQSAWTIGSWSTAPTAPTPTAGGVLYGQGLPFTAGADWGDWVTPGLEREIAPSAYAAVFVTCSSAGTSTQFECQLDFTE